MIGKIVEFSLKKKILILFFGLILVFLGAISFSNLPIEAYPDISDTWVQIITQWPGHAAEEVETQITVPIEITMNGVPHHTAIRSTSLFGLSVVTIIFDEETKTVGARLYVLEKLSQLTMPNGVTPTMGPMGSPVGQIYCTFSTGPTHTPMELKEIEDWDLEKE